MPASIAVFMRDALAEDKYGEEFNSKIDERVKEMNAAQLQGVYNHLTRTAKLSKSPLWRNANRQLIGHVEDLMKERVGVIEKAAKKREEENMKDDYREKLKLMRIEENAAALEAVNRNARTQAEDEITKAEMLRKRQERTEVVVKMAYLQEARDAYWNKLAGLWLGSCLGVTIALSIGVVDMGENGGLVIGLYWLLCSMLCGYLAWRKYKSAQGACLCTSVMHGLVPEFRGIQATSRATYVDRLFSFMRATWLANSNPFSTPPPQSSPSW